MVKHTFGVEIYYKGDFCGQNIYETEIEDFDEIEIVGVMSPRKQLTPNSLSSDLYDILKNEIQINEEIKFQQKLFPYLIGTDFTDYSFKICV